jgi:hypothetical protein
MRAAAAAGMVRLAIGFLCLSVLGAVLALSGLAPSAAAASAGKWLSVASLVLAGFALLPGRRLVT